MTMPFSLFLIAFGVIYIHMVYFQCLRTLICIKNKNISHSPFLNMAYYFLSFFAILNGLLRLILFFFSLYS
ncbi:hypothetical protein EDC94DRAFT_597036 [Helicostylum pulchrum]|nr:hypothetical protein EDC94DRAFT_597036 [Helicostylum pulchrum]